MSERTPPAKDKTAPPTAAKLALPDPAIRLPPHLESAFRKERDDLCRQRINGAGAAAVAAYALFAITDRAMLPDAYREAWATRFFLIIPLLVLCAIGVHRTRPALRAILLSAMVVIAAAGMAWIAGLGAPAHALGYHHCIGLVILFGNLVLGMRFRDAVVSSSLVALIHAASLWRLDTIPPELRFSAWLVFALTTIMSLVANYRLEQDQRRAFLARAGEHERNEELTRAVERFGRLSAEDPLTELANRREFDRRLELEWGRARRAGQSLALILADVDYFEDYNGLYGHHAGDACLQRIAGILASIPQRSSDLAARFCGEQFGVLLPGTAIHDAAELAEQMRTVVGELNLPHATSPAASVVTASFGVAVAQPAVQDDPAALIAAAGAALREAKENGCNRVAVHWLQ